MGEVEPHQIFRMYKDDIKSNYQLDICRKEEDYEVHDRQLPVHYKLSRSGRMLRFRRRMAWKDKALIQRLCHKHLTFLTLNANVTTPQHLANMVLMEYSKPVITQRADGSYGFSCAQGDKARIRPRAGPTTRTKKLEFNFVRNLRIACTNARQGNPDALLFSPLEIAELDVIRTKLLPQCTDEQVAEKEEKLLDAMSAATACSA